MVTNTVLPGGFSAELEPEQPPIPLTANSITVGDCQYNPLFWNVTGPDNGLTMGANTTVHIHDEDVDATAWYYQTGPSSDNRGVLVFTFSRSDNLFMEDCPIEHVTGEGYDPEVNPWWVPTGAGAVEITPKPLIHGQAFEQWLISGAATVPHGNVLHEDQNHTDWAIACYHHIDMLPWDPRPFPITKPERLRIEYIVQWLIDPGDPPSFELYNWLGDMMKHAVPTREGRVDEMTIFTKYVANMSTAELKTAQVRLQTGSVRNTAALKIIGSEIERRQF